jgi:hypothetical protein
MDNIIHPPPIGGGQTDHPLDFRISEIERNIFNLPMSSRSDKGPSIAHIDQDVICTVPLLSDNLISSPYEP